MDLLGLQPRSWLPGRDGWFTSSHFCWTTFTMSPARQGHSEGSPAGPVARRWVPAQLHSCPEWGGAGTQNNFISSITCEKFNWLGPLIWQLSVAGKESTQLISKIEKFQHRHSLRKGGNKNYIAYKLNNVNIKNLMKRRMRKRRQSRKSHPCKIISFRLSDVSLQWQI